MNELQAIEARAEAATPGPWAHVGNGYVEVPPAVNPHRFDMMGETVAQVELQDADAEFIANAREDVPFLLAIVRDQAAQLDAILKLANAHGRQGFLIAPADIRATLGAGA